MGKRSPWKLGVGAGFILIGVYLVFKEFSTPFNILGLVLIAIGIGVTASY